MNRSRTASDNSERGSFQWQPYLALLLGALLLYSLTAQRGVGWQDSGFFQYQILTNGYSNDRGLALVHPLYVAVGQAVKLVPLGPLSLRVNLLSGVWMSLAVANLAAVVSLLTRRWWVGLMTGVMLALLHTCWWLATIAEVYTMSAAALTAELWLLVLLIRQPRGRYLAGLALVAGLHWGVHNMALLALPVYGLAALWLVLTRRLSAWWLAGALGLYLLGSTPILWLIGQEAARTGDLLGAVRSALFGTYGEPVLNTRWGGLFWVNFAIGAMNFASCVLLLAALGWIVMPRRLGKPLAAALLGLTAIELIFVIRYNVPDQFTFMLPSLVMLALSAGVGAGWIADRWPARQRLVAAVWALTIAAGPILLWQAPALARSFRSDMAQQRHPFRDELQYWLVPWKHDETSAQQFAENALQQAGPDGIIVADSTALHPLLVWQEQCGAYRGVAVQYLAKPLPWNGAMAEVLEAAQGRPVYVVDPSLGGLPSRLASWGRMTQQGVLWRWSVDQNAQSISSQPAALYNTDGPSNPWGGDEASYAQ